MNLKHLGALLLFITWSGLPAQVAAQIADPFPGFTLVPIVDGAADLHSHQMSVHGFGGGLIWGSPHETDRSVALKACEGDDHGFPDTLETAILDAFWFAVGMEKAVKNDLLAKSRYCKGYDGSGSGYTGFPIWASNVKQATSYTDLKKAHDEGNLNLLVMSAVSYQPYCKWLPTKNRRYYSFYTSNRSGMAWPAGISHQKTLTYTCNEHDNIMAQIEYALDFEDANGEWYDIVTSVAEAEDAILEGKLAVVLHVESTNLFQNTSGLGTPSDTTIQTKLKFMYEKGVRSVQLTHELNNWAAGVGPQEQTANIARLTQCMEKKDDGNIFNDCIIIAASSQGDYAVSTDANGKNTLGITTAGKKLLRSQFASCMIPDFAHISEKAFNDGYNVAREGTKKFPIFVSHTPAPQLAQDYGTANEYQISDLSLNRVRDTGGILGMRSAPYKMKSQGGVANTCHGSSRSFAQLLKYAQNKNVNIGFAFDFNGMASNVAPRFAATGTKWETYSRDDGWVCPGGGTADTNPSVNGTGTNFDYIGMGNIGQVGDLTADLAKLGAVTTGPSAISDASKNFLSMWRSIEASGNRGTGCKFTWQTTNLP
ncbi:MAG: dipeptidase [Spirochaetia bacterium]|nr:dipeptidase [Spirochaetia bacterium]